MYKRQVGLDVVEQPLVVGYHDHGSLGIAKGVDARSDDLQSVDVKARFGPIEYSETRL